MKHRPANLSPAEHRALMAIQAHIARHGHGPQLPELGESLGITSKGTLHRYVQALIEKGYLAQPQHSYRSLRLLPQPSITLPLLGRIAAGRPLEAIANQDELNLAELFAGSNRYALKVKGDSMRDAGILDGDTIIIEQADSARNGDIVVALIDDNEVTLKTFRQHRNGDIELIPQNADMSAMRYRADQVKLQGILVGQLRQYRK